MKTELLLGMGVLIVLLTTYIIHLHVKKSRAFFLYVALTTFLFFTPIVLMLSSDASISARITWSIPFLTLYLGSIYLFFIADDILVEKDSVIGRFRRGILALVVITITMGIFDLLSRVEILRVVSIPAYLLGLIYSWNPLILSSRFVARMPFPLNLLSVFFAASLLSFYELVLKMAKEGGRRALKYAFFGLLLIFSLSAIYYYLFPVATFQVEKAGGMQVYSLDASANAVLDAIPTIEVLRLNGINWAKWYDGWEHGPILVKTDYTKVSTLRYSWIKSISLEGSESFVRPARSVVTGIPLWVLLFLLRGYTWLLILAVLALYLLGRVVENQRRVLAVIIAILLIAPFPSTVYFRPSVKTEDYVQFLNDHRFFFPSHIGFESYPEGGGGAMISRDKPLPLIWVSPHAYGENFVLNYRIREVSGFSPTIYSLYLNLYGDLVYSQGYVVILVILLLHLAIRFREGGK